ncbi:MAG: response regulator [Candidatus Omnitrophica bacterium]|nr:response regulator [Candidatus Omnitrophota bacterium]
MPTVLVVDDEPQLVELVQLRLEDSGYRVITAPDGSAGLRKAQTEQPDVIILDVMMPYLNGYEVCQLLKQDAQYRHIPIIMFTAKTQAKDEQMACECGADAYLRKPFQPEEMLATLRAVLSQPRTPKEVKE